MAQYYYLMTQLPTITPNSAPSMPYAEFKDLCLRLLNKKDARLLETLSLTPPCSDEEFGIPIVDTFYSYERALRLFLVQIRAKNLNRDVKNEVFDFSTSSPASYARRHAQAVVAIDDPLEAELFLLHEKIKMVDMLSRKHMFNSQAVFAYAILLLLHERMAQFVVEAGRAEYKIIYDKILEGKA